MNLSIQKSVDEVREVFRAGDFDLLVVDTFSQLSGIDDENSSTKRAEVINNIRSIRQVKPGASSITIHHTNAVGNKARGSTAHLANMDVLWMLKRESGGTFSMSSRSADGGKMKDRAEEKIVGLKLVNLDGSAVIVWTGHTPTSEHWVPVRELLSDGEFHTAAEVRAACGIEVASGKAYDSFKADLSAWVSQKVIEKEGATRAAKYRMPSIPGQTAE